MTITGTRRVQRDPYAVAARARSVLACPSGAELRIGGSPLPLADEVLSFTDDAGRPTLACSPDAALLVVASRRDVVTLHLTSGVRGSTGAVEPDALDLTGRLVLGGVDECGGCAAPHRVVVLEPSAVVLTALGRTLPVPVADYLSPEHALNRGYLQRTAEHASTCHGDELRRAVSRRTGMPTARLVGASLAALTPQGVELRWIDTDGAHVERLRFPAPARDAVELGRLLREHLDPGVC